MRDRISKSWFQRRWPALLLALFLLETLVLAWRPVSREVWLAEGLTAWIPALFLIVLYLRGIRFSNFAYGCVALWFFLHTIGGHYTFEEVPVQWLAELLGWQRNNYDRICHFLIGTAAVPALEFLEGRGHVRDRATAVVLTVLGIFGIAAIFELIEWQYAAWADPEAGAAFLGSQGDVWDAQKDMLSDGLGAIVFSFLYCLRHRRAALPR